MATPVVKKGIDISYTTKASPVVTLTVSRWRPGLLLKSLIAFASLAYICKRPLRITWKWFRSLLSGVIAHSRRRLLRDPFVRLAGTSVGQTCRLSLGDYTMGQQLAIGTFGQVFECRQQGSTKNQLLVKIVPKDRHPLMISASTSQARGAFGRRLAASPANIEEETFEFQRYMTALQSLKHENVVRYVQFFADSTSFYFLMERCPGVELLEDVTTKDEWLESDGRLLTEQMLEALRYVHGRGIMHRDVKLENLIVHRPQRSTNDSRQSPVILKLIDFGLGRAIGGVGVTGAAGTPGFAAPEVYMRGFYTEGVDVFSIGVVLYILFTGRPPFRAPNSVQNINAHLQCLFDGPDWSSAPFPLISRPGRNLIDMLLIPNPSARYSAAKALEHAWFKKGVPETKVVLWRSSTSEVQFLKVMGVWDGSSKSMQSLESLKMPLKKVSEWSDDAEDREQSLILQALCVSIVHQMPIAVCVADPNGDDCPLLAVSYGFTQLTGFRDDQCIGKNCRFLNEKRAGEISQESRQGMRRAVQEETTFFGVVPNAKADGTPFNNLLHLSPLDLGSTTYMVGVGMAVEDESPFLQGQRREESLAVVRKAHSAIHHWVRCSQGGVGAKKLALRKASKEPKGGL